MDVARVLFDGYRTRKRARKIVIARGRYFVNAGRSLFRKSRVLLVVGQRGFNRVRRFRDRAVRFGYVFYFVLPRGRVVGYDFVAAPVFALIIFIRIVYSSNERKRKKNSQNQN